jgi:glycosyltransferase involved in cell wall biosynthesis
MLVSVVLNVMNEERYIADLLDSLAIQEQPLEIIVVDADSEDRTRDVVRRFVQKYPFIKLFVHAGSRGESTNFGISQATGEVIAFTGGTTWRTRTGSRSCAEASQRGRTSLPVGPS